MSFMTLVNKSKFLIVKNAPKILTTLGIISYAGSIYTTVKSSQQINDRLAADLEKLRALKESLKDKEAINMGTVVVKDTRREMLKTSLHVVGTTIKVYLPTLILFGTGTGCILGANNILYKRQAALTAAYGALNTTFAKYRQRVADKYGVEEEKAIRQGAELVKDPKTGEVTYVHKDDKALEYDFSVMIDETCDCWQTNAPLSITASYIEHIREALQYRLEQEGRLFVIDVYKALGIKLHKLTPEKLWRAQRMGWVYKDGVHEVCIDFGLVDPITGTRTDKYYKCIRDDQPCFFIELNPEGDLFSDKGLIFTDYAKKL